MKKLILFLTVVLISFSTKAQTFYVVNNTCGIIKMTLFGHTPSYPNCSELQAQTSLNNFGGTSTIPLPMNVGNCWITASYPSTASGANFIPDGIKFEADDTNGCIEYGSVGGCGSFSTSFLGSCNFCGGSGLQVSWSVSGSDITVTFN